MVGSSVTTLERGKAPRGVYWGTKDRFLRIIMGTVARLSDTLPAGLRGGLEVRNVQKSVCRAVKEIEHT